MPSDHLKDIQAVRAIERATGVTHSDARFALHRAVSQQVLEERSRRFIAAQASPNEQPIDRTRVVGSETKSTPRAGFIAPPAAAVPATTPTGNSVSVTVFANGVIASMYALGTDPVEE